MKDDGSSNCPGTVRRRPDGGAMAIRIAEPAAWVVVDIATGFTKTIKIASYLAGDIYGLNDGVHNGWPVVTHGVRQ